MSKNREEIISLEISSLREDLQNLIIQRNELRRQLGEIREKLSARREELKKKREDLSNIRNEIAKLREKIFSLKNDIQTLRSRLGEMFKELKQISTEFRELSRGRESLIAIDELRAKIEQLEWTLITTPNIEPEREKEIVSEISRLEQKLKTLLSLHMRYGDISSRYEKTKNAISELRSEIEKKRSVLRDAINQLNNLKAQRDKLKNEISNIIDDIKTLKNQRDEIKNRLATINNEIQEKRRRYYELLRELKRIRDEYEKSVQQRMLQEKKAKVLDKISRGERVTLYDLYVLYGQEKQEK
ncbi:hypothetical protein QPL79_00545 [Ignisphaera sp. 4213-co]|uniref:Chromosome partition protein Smc n=1 Tax=Ignisphaera cupida TaxID=3050454 RepID=A0ABD4Z3G4_9CREN|nr:hypothetical protein [Ignisphaera sp. 4213-co]MDK6027856.1 hypothetical protein [Ignisphaera sp. 4213-co]